MVNCITCRKSFRLRIGKSSKTRCESCATIWRDKQLLEEENERLRQAKEIELKIRELNLQEKQMQLEKQKVTIRETSSFNGSSIELTCYYDQSSRDKIQDLLSGARRALPKPPSNQPPDLSTRLVPRRRQYLSPLSDDDDDGDDTQQQLLRRPRKLPSIESFSTGTRLKPRFRLDDEYSTSANSTGLSVD